MMSNNEIKRLNGVAAASVGLFLVALFILMFYFVVQSFAPYDAPESLKRAIEIFPYVAGIGLGVMGGMLSYRYFNGALDTHSE